MIGELNEHRRASPDIRIYRICPSMTGGSSREFVDGRQTFPGNSVYTVYDGDDWDDSVVTKFTEVHQTSPNIDRHRQHPGINPLYGI